jgi:hypothetical protein
MYPNTGPKTRAYIIGEKQALLALSDTLKKAAMGVVGTDSITLYANDGHEYEVYVTKDLTESEWQILTKPENLSSIQVFAGLKAEIAQRNLKEKANDYS